MTEMKRKPLILVLSLFTASTISVVAKAETLHARLSGFQEVPSLFTEATGAFRMKIREQAGEIKYRLSYSGFDSLVRFAHIHFGSRATTGGVMFWLCDSAGAGPAGTPACPPGGGTVEDTLTAEDMVLNGQGLVAMDFDEAIESIRAGAGYVNVHSDNFGGGELRGQIARTRGGSGSGS